MLGSIARSWSFLGVLLRLEHGFHPTIMLEVLVPPLQAQGVDLSIGVTHQQVSILHPCCYYSVVVHNVHSGMGIHDLLRELDQLSGCWSLGLGC